MKISQAKKYLEKKGLDAIVLFNKDPNFSYFIQGDFEHGIMFITRNNNYLFLSPLYAPRFRDFRIITWESFEKDFKRFIKKHRIKKVGINNAELKVKQKNFLSKHFSTRDASRFLEELRQAKTPEEVAKLRKACAIADSIFDKIITNFKFRTEADIVRFMKMEALKNNTELSFEPVVANARNAVTAHHQPGSKLKKGFLIMDFGINYKGYLSDMTRTIYLGKPSKKEKELYEKVLSIQEKCIAKAEQGMTTEKLYNYSLKLFGADKKYFIHGLGHGIGIKIHEKPSIGRASDTLEKNSIFTIEPGYYNQKTGTGIRIEDDVFLGDKKEILTRSPKELICIKLK